MYQLFFCNIINSKHILQVIYLSKERESCQEILGNPPGEEVLLSDTLKEKLEDYEKIINLANTESQEISNRMEKEIQRLTEELEDQRDALSKKSEEKEGDNDNFIIYNSTGEYLIEGSYHTDIAIQCDMDKESAEENKMDMENDNSIDNAGNSVESELETELVKLEVDDIVLVNNCETPELQQEGTEINIACDTQNPKKQKEQVDAIGEVEEYSVTDSVSNVSSETLPPHLQQDTLEEELNVKTLPPDPEQDMVVEELKTQVKTFQDALSETRSEMEELQKQLHAIKETQRIQALPKLKLTKSEHGAKRLSAKYLETPAPGYSAIYKKMINNEPGAITTKPSKLMAKCFRCHQPFNTRDNHKMACQFHPRSKEKVEKYSSKGRLIGVYITWPCCSQPVETGGCTFGEHI